MDQIKKMWLLFSVSFVINSQASPENAQTKQDASSVVIATEYYNMGSNEEAVYLPFPDDSKYLQDVSSDLREIQFTLKETLCLKSETQTPEHCLFRDNGAIQVCTAQFDEKNNLDNMTCNAVVKKSRTKRCHKKPKKKPKKKPLKKFKRKSKR
ncbi:cathelicidin-related peptide Pt_CRAMP2-like [Bombina bombina]|uniref:cathelicidin-related peptide Pt_CRAMP2-like n=1 Tax=Bombina bombina TaxID=8345 RepID=UPI00235AA3DA|nr:cathelicidin-related peptide Pt_CRAMP2-like [Bombina bombina]